MARYLLVAHQTATDPLVIERAREIDEGDPHAVFTILVPETHVEGRLVCDEVATREAARVRSHEAAEAFREAGLNVDHAEVGDCNPLQAIRDELRRHPDGHDAVVLSTFAPGLSRWLHLDLPRRVEQQHDLPVLHVYPDGEAAWQRTAELRRDLANGKPPEAEMPDRAPASGWRARLASIPFSAVFIGLLIAHIALMTGLALAYDLRFLRIEVALVLLMGLLLIATGAMAAHMPHIPWRRPMAR